MGHKGPQSELVLCKQAESGCRLGVNIRLTAAIPWYPYHMGRPYM